MLTFTRHDTPKPLTYGDLDVGEAFTSRGLATLGDDNPVLLKHFRGCVSLTCPSRTWSGGPDASIIVNRVNLDITVK